MVLVQYSGKWTSIFWGFVGDLRLALNSVVYNKTAAGARARVKQNEDNEAEGKLGKARTTEVRDPSVLGIADCPFLKRKEC